MALELQADFGRGLYHLTYNLNEGDMVAYQTGSWLVDHVMVGDGSPARLRFARVDAVQINWTHNCEHGLVRATALHRNGDSAPQRMTLNPDEEVQFDPSQLIARIPATWDGNEAQLAVDLPPDEDLLWGAGYEDDEANDEDDEAPPPQAHRAGAHARPGRASTIHCREPLECTEENVQLVLDSFKAQCTTMFGCHQKAADIGITGDLSLFEIDGPIVVLSLSGQFWHKRETVMRNAGTFLMQVIPEIADVVPADEDDLLDKIFDGDTGALLEDRRSPDFNGDRAALEYQGIDPDNRGPFPS